VLGKPRGNRGELTGYSTAARPERFRNLAAVYLFGTGERREVESVWEQAGRLVFKFRGIDTISAAELLRGAEVRLPIAERAALEPGEFFQSDLIGSQVLAQDGEILGRVTGWQDAGGAGLLELDNGMLIPFARSICVEIDPAARRIRVQLPEGLKGLNRP